MLSSQPLDIVSPWICWEEFYSMSSCCIEFVDKWRQIENIISLQERLYDDVERMGYRDWLTEEARLTLAYILRAFATNPPVDVPWVQKTSTISFLRFTYLCEPEWLIGWECFNTLIMECYI